MLMFTAVKKSPLGSNRLLKNVRIWHTCVTLRQCEELRHVGDNTLLEMGLHVVELEYKHSHVQKMYEKTQFWKVHNYGTKTTLS